MLHAWSADVFAARGVRPPDPVLAPVLTRGRIALLTGPRGAGKSWLALAMAHAAARGGTLAGWRARKPARVVYVDAAAGEALLHARLAALSPESQPQGLVLLPGDAQAQGLPDLSLESGRAALDELTVDADLVVLDGLSSLVRLGRGVGARWAALTDWLRALRRRGVAVLLVDAAEPRALAALADTVLRLERPADGAADSDLRVQVRVAASRAAMREVQRFELRLSLRRNGAVWTRLDDVDHRAIVAWRLREGDYTTREIARKLGVSPATAWRLVERGEAMPPHLRDGLPAGEEPPPRVRSARQKRRRGANTLLPTGEKEGPAAQQREDEGEIMAEIAPSALRAPPHPNPLPVGERAPESASDIPLPSWEREGPGAQRREGEGASTANSDETVKQAKQEEAPASLDDVATDKLVEILLARRRYYGQGLPPPLDPLAAFAYEELLSAARGRLTTAVLNKRMTEDDARPFHLRAPSGASPVA